MRIFSKIFISHTGIGLLTVLTSSFLFYAIFKNALIQRTVGQLTSINVLKKNQIENYFNQSQKDLLFLFSRTDFIEQSNEIADIEHHNVHLRTDQEKEFREIGNLYNFDNLILTDNHLNSVYSINEDTLFLNTISREKVDSILHINKKFIYFDASATDSTHNTILLYLIPIHSKKDTVNIAGFVIVKEHFQKFQKILFENTGEGKTGESYLVANDKKMRSESRFFPNKAPLSILVNTEAVNNVFNVNHDNKEEKNILFDYRGEKVLSVYKKLDSDLQWAIISEIDYSEAFKSIDELKNYMLSIILSLIVFILLVTFFISDAISNPILYLKDIIISLSKGVIPDSKIEAKENDEIGQITDATKQLVEGMKRTTEFAHEIGLGNFQATFNILSENDTLGLALLQMRDKLKMLQEREVRLVREKASALLEGQENERKRIVRELHDGIGQYLTVVKLRVDAMEGDAKAKEEVLELITGIIAEVRRISYNVMPSVLVDFGLQAALRGLSENIKKFSGVDIEFTYIKETVKPLNFEVSVPVFRIAQEGLNNIIKHAKATKVHLDVIEQEDYLYLKLSDNGIGFVKDQVKSKGGFGLTSMKERAKLLNGDLHIESIPGEGTVTELEIPIQRD